MAKKVEEKERIHALTLSIDIINVRGGKPRVQAELKHCCDNEQRAIRLIEMFLIQHKKKRKEEA